MKKLLALVMLAAFATTGFAAEAAEPTAKPAVVKKAAKKAVKHHKKAAATAKVPAKK